jgi:hypothetical protein
MRQHETLNKYAVILKVGEIAKFGTYVFSVTKWC